jgi:DNA repair protein RadC
MARAQARDFDTIEDALDRAANFRPTHVVDTFGEMPKVYSPSGGGYLMRELYSAKGRYHWPRQGVRVKRLPEAAKPLVPRPMGGGEKPRSLVRVLAEEGTGSFITAQKRLLQGLAAKGWRVSGNVAELVGGAYRFRKIRIEPRLRNAIEMERLFPDPVYYGAYREEWGRLSSSHRRWDDLDIRDLTADTLDGIAREALGEADRYHWESGMAGENPVEERGHSPGDYRPLISDLQHQGWRIEQTKQGHYKAFPPDPRAPMVLFSTNPHAMKQVLSQLRRSGYQDMRRAAENPARPVTRVMAKKIGNDLRVRWADVDLEQLRMGIEEEQEHTSDLHKAAQIALDHLREDRHYYTKLKGAGLEAEEARCGPACGPDRETGKWAHRGGCRPGRPLCRMERREKGLCSCPAYSYPHRTGGGMCVYGPEGSARFERHVHGPERDFEPMPPVSTRPEDESFSAWVKRAKERFTAKEAGRAEGVTDEDAAEELLLFAENTGELYPEFVSIQRTVRTLQINGRYNPETGWQLWMPWVEKGAKLYKKEIDTDIRFSQRALQIAARELASKQASVLGHGHSDDFLWRDRGGGGGRGQANENPAACGCSAKENPTSKLTWQEDRGYDGRAPLSWYSSDGYWIWQPREKMYEVTWSRDERGSPSLGTFKTLEAAKAKAQKHWEQNDGTIRENPVDENGIPWVKVERDPKIQEELVEIQNDFGPIAGAKDVYRLLSPWTAKQEQENLLVVLLDIHSEIKGVALIHKGERDRVSVDPADVLRPAIERGAKGLVLIHNHPSGRADHSDADADLTKAIRDACDTNSITFVDHVVIGTNEYYSFADKKLHKLKK